MNPNVFRMQENPDGLEGHQERERLKNQLIDEYDPKTQPPKEIPVSYPSPYKVKVTRRVLRMYKNIYIWDECDFYDHRCEKRDCLICQTNGIPKGNIKNCIEWM